MSTPMFLFRVEVNGVLFYQSNSRDAIEESARKEAKKQPTAKVRLLGWKGGQWKHLQSFHEFFNLKTGGKK